MTIKIKVGSLVLTEARDESIPQEFAAWHQTVRVASGAYEVFAYLDPEGGSYHVRRLSALCAGITVSSNFRSHMLGVWGKSDNNRNGQPAVVHVGLPTFGLVDSEQPPSLLAQVTLCDAIVRTEWEPREIDPRSEVGKMWRFTWNPARRPIIIEQPRHSGGTCLAAFEDTRRFLVEGTAMTRDALRELDDVSLSLHSVDQLAVHETAAGWSFKRKERFLITRLK